jgi:hypothetical protein
MKYYSIVIILAFLFTVSLDAQTVEGTVFEAGQDKAVPLTGVNIYWSGTQLVTVSDEKVSAAIQSMFIRIIKTSNTLCVKILRLGKLRYRRVQKPLSFRR